MKLWNKYALCTAGALGLAALGGCITPDDTTGPDDTGNTSQTVDVVQNISTNTTWKSGNTYVLKSQVFVDGGATLTIEPGVTIKGDGRVALVVTTGGRIDAQGTADKPIVMTSVKPEGSRAPGDWQGLILLGKAPINVAGGTAKIEGFPESQPGITYGGSDAAHDCGTLKYVRIEFAGFKLTDNNETNGLTTGGCGSATSIDYVQIHKGLDDGVEMFGGNANLKHIVVTQTDDDGLDWDLGYSGKVQFLVVQHNKDVGNCGFEGDNNPTDPVNARPLSKPVIYNVSLIGGDNAAGSSTPKHIGMHLKNGTAGTIRNTLVAYFSTLAVDIDKAPAVAMYDAGELSLQNSVFWKNKGEVTASSIGNEGTDNDGGFDESARLLEPANNNRSVDPQLEDALNLTRPSFKPRAGSPLLTGAATPPNDGFFDPSATFVGAVGTSDWTAGWTAYPAN